METKQLIITPPEGYEIDEENSTLECIKFKKVSNITYAEVADKLLLGKEVYYIETYGGIGKIPSSSTGRGNCREPNDALSKEQLHRILAINQLFNITKYYNSDWEPTYETRGFIIDSMPSNGYCIVPDIRFMKALPRFRKIEDAQAVINNPNFRPILDSIFK